MFNTKAGKEYEDKTSNLFQTNKILWKVAILQTVVIVGLVVGYLNLKETVCVSVEIPPKLYVDRELKIKKGLNWANKTYFQVWGKALVEDVSNFNIDNISEKMTTLEKMMRPSVAVKEDDTIVKYTKAILNNKISQKFDILKEKVINISKNEKQLIYKGIAHATVGKRKIKPKECKYIINLKLYNDGVLYVEKFGSNCL